MLVCFIKCITRTKTIQVFATTSTRWTTELYVDLLGTSKQPELALVERAVSEEFAVPFDDKRSIRRIVLDETVLAVQSRPMSQRDEPRPDSVVKRFPL